MKTKIEKVKIDSIETNDANPRYIQDGKFAKLVKSLESFPEMMELRPIIVNQKGVILGGNMRYLAAKEAGWKTVPVMKVNWTEEQQREFLIKDNVNAGFWDYTALAESGYKENLEEWGVGMLGISDEGIGELEDLDEGEEEEDTGTDPQSKQKTIQIGFDLQDYQEAKELYRELREEAINIAPYLLRKFKEEVEKV